MHLRHQADERVACVDVTSSGVMVTLKFAEDKVVPRRERERGLPFMKWLQDSARASLRAQLVKNPPAKQETPV